MEALLTILIVTVIVEMILQLVYSSIRHDGKELATRLRVLQGQYEDRFGERRDACNFLRDLDKAWAGKAHPNLGGTAAIGNSLGEGDVVGAATLTVSKVALEVAGGFMSKTIGNTLRKVGERISRDGPKGEEQMKWEVEIAREMSGLLDIRKRLQSTRHWMYGVAYIAIFASLIAVVNY